MGGKLVHASLMRGKGSVESSPSQTKLADVEASLLAVCGVSTMYLLGIAD